MATLSQLPTKKELRDWCGYLSFHCALMNLDIIGIRLKSGETIIVTYRGAHKTGFMYEGGNLTQADILEIYNDVPEDYNDIERTYEQQFSNLVEVLRPRKDMYVWLNENEIVKTQTVKK